LKKISVVERHRIFAGSMICILSVLFGCAIMIIVPFVNREDFERNGLSSLITVNVRDIQGKGFLEEHRGAADVP
jgi:hypothetical protein